MIDDLVSLLQYDAARARKNADIPPRMEQSYERKDSWVTVGTLYLK